MNLKINCERLSESEIDEILSLPLDVGDDGEDLGKDDPTLVWHTILGNKEEKRRLIGQIASHVQDISKAHLVAEEDL